MSTWKHSARWRQRVPEGRVRATLGFSPRNLTNNSCRTRTISSPFRSPAPRSYLRPVRPARQQESEGWRLPLALAGKTTCVGRVEKGVVALHPDQTFRPSCNLCGSRQGRSSQSGNH